MNRLDIFDMIEAERARQGEKWAGHHSWGTGDCSSHAVAPATKAVVLAEECGEVARAVLDNNRAGLVVELVQVAAVAVAWLESLRRP